MSSGDTPKQTIGYWYSVGVHMLLCHGPIDGVKQIRVGEKIAWPNAADTTAKAADNTALASINEASLFGGEEKEGGVVGDVDLLYGSSSQGVNEYLAGMLGGNHSGALNGDHLAGATTLVIDGVDSGITANVGDTVTVKGNDTFFGLIPIRFHITEQATSSGGAITLHITPGLAVNSANNKAVTIYLDSHIPAFRGLVSAVLKCVKVGTSPYIKQWAFLAKRTAIQNDGSTQWNSTKADINGDMNPAHIIRECLVNNQWGLGYDVGYIDDDSFTAAANTLYAEGFGLSLLWDNTTTIEDFITDVTNHIDGVCFQDNTTGKFVLKLARDDYDVEDLEEFDDSDIKEVQDFKRPTYGELTNQVSLTYSDVANDQDALATAQDIALIDLQGGAIIDSSFKYVGITKAAIAAKVAARLLRQAATPLARMTIMGNRSMAHLQRNDVFLLTWPIFGITRLPVRIMSVNYGSLTEGTVRFDVIEDVFKAATALYATPPSTAWTDPISTPQADPARVLYEIPYCQIVKSLGAEYSQTLDADAGFLGVGAMKPSGDSLGYELFVRDGVSLPFNDIGRNEFTPTATIGADLPENAADATILLEGGVDIDYVTVGSFAFIGDEVVSVKAIDTANNQITIARGILDTVPTAHDEGDRIWFVGVESAFVPKEYAATETPGVKILPITGKGKLAEASATAHNAAAMNSRQTRPYPPGNVKINTVSYPATLTGAPTVSWSHRDRTQQTVSLIEHSEGNIGPEAGTTYTLKIYGDGGTLKRTVTGLTGTDYTYLDADEKADNGGNLNSTLRFVLSSVRDAIESWQVYDITATRV